MFRFVVKLFENEHDALVRLAESERRDPREQAALFIRQGLEQRGLLQSDGEAANAETGINEQVAHAGCA